MLSIFQMAPADDQGDAMYVRIVRGQTRDGQVEELVRRWQTFIVPQLQAAPGFHHVYFCGDCDANAMAAVSVWDSQPDADVLNRAMHDFTSEARSLLRGQPTIEDYEILGEFSAATAS
jgi:quinol monooxygenase YgiN